MESKVKTLTNNANDALASVTNENIIDFFSNRITLPLNAQKVIDALHSFLGLNLKNGIYKSLNKGEKLVGLLLDLDLAGVKQTRVKKAESKLENLSENSMKSYNEVIRALFTWLKNKIELWHELNQQKEEVKEVHVSKFQHSRVKSESKSNSALIEARRKRKAQDWSSLDFKVEASEIEGSKFPEWIGSKIDSLSSNIWKSDINELTKVKNPTSSVWKVIQALMYLFGSKRREDREFAVRDFTGGKINALANILRFDFLTLKFKDWAELQKILKDVSPEIIVNASKSAYSLYMWIKNVVDMRIGTELYGEDRIKLESQGMAKTEVKRSSKSATKLKKTEVKVQEEIKTSLNASDITRDLIETIKEPSKTTTLAKDEVLEEKYYDYYRTLGYDWRLFWDSPTRRRILRERSAERRRYGHNLDDVMRNSIKAEETVLERVRKDPIRNSFSYDINSYSDLNYLRHKSDIEIDTAIQKERMSPKNIKKINSKVSYHWSPKRKREMQVEADIMTGYYGYGFIYDIVRDVTLRRLSYDEGRRHLLKHGFELKKNEPTSTEKFRASPLRRGDRTEVYQESPITDNKRTLLKELNLGKDLLNKAAKNITESTFLDISSDNNITWADQQLIRSFISVLELINNGRVEYYPDWAVIQSELKSTNFWLTKVDNLEYMIDEYAFSYYKIDELKQNFTRLAPDSSNKAYVTTIREFLLEAFCLIDIVEELRGYSKLRSSLYYTYDSTVDRIVREHSSPKRQVEIQEQKEPEQINETKEEEIKQNDTIKEEINESSPAVQQEAAQVEVENTDQEIRHVTKKEVEEPRIEIKSPMSSPIEREIRHNIVQSRSTRKKITTKSYKKGGKVVKETTTTYFSPNSRAKATVIEKKVKVKKAASPTRRIIDMKNSSLKHKQNAANVKGASGKMLYTLDPKNAYLVTNEYPQGTSREEIVRKTLDGKHGFAEDFIDEDGKITTKYYFTSPHAQKVKSNGRVEEVHREIIESPTRKLWVQEWQDEPIVRDILSPVNFESRRDFIKRIEERTKNINDDVTYHNGSFNREYVRHEDRSERYHKLLRDTLSYN